MIPTWMIKELERRRRERNRWEPPSLPVEAPSLPVEPPVRTDEPLPRPTPRAPIVIDLFGDD